MTNFVLQRHDLLNLFEMTFSGGAAHRICSSDATLFFLVCTEKITSENPNHFFISMPVPIFEVAANFQQFAYLKNQLSPQTST